MLTTPRSQFVEKIITSPQGIDFRVVFLVYEENGAIKGKIVSATPVSSSVSLGHIEVISLPGHIFSQVFEFVRSTFTKEIVSPYTDLSFFVSQPTRAPSK